MLALAVLTITLTAQQAWAVPAEVSAQAVSGHDYLGGAALATDSGRGVAVGDLDADGIDDIAIGVPGSDHVCLVRGAIAMGAAPEDVSVLCKAGAVAPNAFRINAPTALTGSGGFGLGLEIADIDCDGQNDLIIGDPLADPVAGLAGGVKVDGGAIHVLHKSAGLVWGQEIFADNWRLYTGGNGYSIMSGGAQLEMFGYPAAGDIDNDGLVDLVVGAPIHRHGFARAGRVYLLGTAAVVEFNFCANGPINNPVSQPLSIMDGAPACGGSCSCVASACIDMKKDDAWFGQGLDVADVNTDGIDDLVVGSPSDGVAVESRVYIKYGPIGASPAVYPVDYPSPYTSADSCIGDGDAVFDRLGTDLAAADYDADGKLELYIGAPLYSGGGMAQNGGVFVLSGGTYSGLNTSINTAPAVWYGKVNDGNLGWGVDLGDLDGDGTLDLSVGGSGIGDPNGTTHVIKEPAPDPCLTLVCNDGNECTSDSCALGACVFTPVANDTVCTDDGLYCTGSESCQAGACTSGGDPCVGGAECDDSCNEAANSCAVAANTACTSDGNECTDDVCDGTGACAHPAVANDTACTDDGLYCTGAETCQAAACTSGGDPCVGGAECADSCDEAANSCDVSAGTACTNDGNECTDDQCDGAGACAHPALANGTACSDDGLYCTGIETCQAAACTSGGDPCLALGTCYNCEEATDTCDSTDPDADGVCDPDDNCAAEYNPDQADYDCTDPAFWVSGGCSGVVPVGKEGCCDGGDVCDDCPAFSDQNCTVARSGGVNIGVAGGTLTTTDGCVTIDVPAGAIATDTSFSITGFDHSSGSDKFKVEAGAGVGMRAILTPEDTTAPGVTQFASAITVSMCWDDRINDGFVDKGTCSGGTMDGLPCSKKNPDNCPAGGTCSSSSSLQEQNLVLKRNSTPMLPAATKKCKHNYTGSGCSLRTADCVADPDTPVPLCCDDNNADPVDPASVSGTGVWPFETCKFSDMYMGETAGDLVPGKGSAKKNCVLEWSIRNPLNRPFFDRRGYINPEQTCRDGDPVCDGDGQANGVCVFRLAACLNLDDSRLVDPKTGDLACSVSGVDSLRVKKPRPDSRKPHDAANGTALRDAIASLDPAGQATLGGRAGSEITYSSPVTVEGDCSDLVEFQVPLRNDGTRAGKGKLKVQAISTPGTNGRGTRDSDSLKFVCEPAGS